MPFFYGFDSTFLFLVVPAMILALVAQHKVKSTFEKYSHIGNRRGLTGAEVAKQIMNSNGIYDVSVERIRGNLTDHYDPAHKVLRLSDDVYGSTSLSAIGVAAHETGHAIQHAHGYGPLWLRSAMAPITNISSRMAMPLIFIGLLLGGMRNFSFGYTLILVGIMLFGVAVLFSLVTLPVEFNASRRAVAILEDRGFLTGDEIGPARKVLQAAAMTYVAAAAVAIANLLRLFTIFARRD